MPLDAAAIQALSGGFTNWDAKRSMAERALQFQQQSTNIAENSLRNQQIAEAKLAEYQDTINKAGLLDPDKKKVQAVNDQLKKKIKDGIIKYHGDVSRYMDSGGLTELHEYQQDLMNSPEMQRGQMNFYNYNKAKADAAAGLTLREINGKHFDEHYKDYLDGKSEVLPYEGAFKPTDIDYAKEFGSVYGNANKTPQQANLADIFTLAYHANRKAGLSDADAKQAAKAETTRELEKIAAGGHYYQYKSEDPLDRQLKVARINKLNSGHGAGGGVINDYWRGIQTGEVKPSTFDSKSNTYGYQIPAQWQNGWIGATGIERKLTKDKEGHEYYQITNKGAVKNRNNILQYGTLKPIDLSNTNDFNIEPTTEHVWTTDKDGKPIEGLRAKLHMDDADEAKIGGEDIGKAQGISYNRNHPWLPWGGHNATVDVILPLDYSNTATHFAILKGSEGTGKRPMDIEDNFLQEQDNE
jgi:hypothetical protein